MKNFQDEPRVTLPNKSTHLTNYAYTAVVDTKRLSE